MSRLLRSGHTRVPALWRTEGGRRRIRRAPLLVRALARHDVAPEGAATLGHPLGRGNLSWPWASLDAIGPVACVRVDASPNEVPKIVNQVTRPHIPANPPKPHADPGHALSRTRIRSDLELYEAGKPNGS